VCADDESGHFPDLRGLYTLQLLVRRPGQPVPWADLDPSILRLGQHSVQPALDEAAVATARADLDRLRREVEDAADEVERADSQRRLDELSARLGADIGLAGRVRDLNSLTDRLRPKMAGRLSTVYENFRRADPPLAKLARHFEDYVSSTPSGFIYDPPPPAPAWKTEKDRG
jgi:hypothetical protein